MFDSRPTSRQRKAASGPAASETGQRPTRSRDKGSQDKGSRDKGSDTAVAAVTDLSPLDQRSIAVHLVAQGRERVLRGVGSYGADPDLGGVLRVAVEDDAGAFELLFVESQWTGTIESGAALGYDYLLRVG
jgi:hypothetical protein